MPFNAPPVLLIVEEGAGGVATHRTKQATEILRLMVKPEQRPKFDRQMKMWYRIYAIQAFCYKWVPPYKWYIDWQWDRA